MSAPVQKSRSFPARTIARTVWSASARCRNVRSAVQRIDVDGVAAGGAVERQHCHRAGRLEARALDCHRI